MAMSDAEARDVELINLFLPRRNQIQTGRPRPAAAFPHAPVTPSKVVTKDVSFSIFKNDHIKEAARIIKELMKAPTVDDFLGLSDDYCDVLNYDLYFYCVSVAASHRKDVPSTKIPPVYQTRVSQFVKSGAIKDAYRAALAGLPAPRGVVPSVLADERAIDYWREDLLLNSHHWHWHLVYPLAGADADIFVDRRGEMFYYMHKQMLARYDAERLSNGLGYVIPFDEWDKPIKEGYDPELITANGKYAPRLDQKEFSDETVAELNQMKADIKYEEMGTDISGLGTDIEQTIHNNGHMFFHALREPSEPSIPGGVMGYTSTAVRDVIFFRWHKCIDELFKPYKAKLTPYTENELVWSGIKVASVEVLDEILKPTATLRTFMRAKNFDISCGLDLGELPPGSDPVNVSLTHIDHQEFSYRVTVRNTTGTDQKATVRVYMVPDKDDSGVENTMENFNNRCIEMDRFYQDIPAAGCTIVRAASDSSVTLPWAQSIGVMQDDAGIAPRQTEENFCGCGWPEHMQIPRGTTDGMGFKVIVMLTNYEDDKVAGMSRAQTACKNAASYCGLRDKKYPDKRLMGYPFNKPMARGTLADFAQGKDNVNYTSVSILDTRKTFVSD